MVYKYSKTNLKSKNYRNNQNYYYIQSKNLQINVEIKIFPSKLKIQIHLNSLPKSNIEIFQ